MKRIICFLISTFLLFGITAGCQEESIPDPYPPLHFGINHYYDLVPSIESRGHGDALLSFLPFSEADSTTVDRRFYDEDLLNAVGNRSLLNDQDILIFTWDLQEILKTFDYIPEDYYPVSGTIYGNGVVRIVYGNDSYVEMIEIIRKYSEPVTGNEKHTHYYQDNEEKPVVKDGQMHIFVSAKDGHILIMNGPLSLLHYRYSS